MPKNLMTPLLKWAGGKTQILNHITARMPQSYNTYHEPFIGGASVLLHISPQRAFINDINRQLINLYVQLKNRVDTLLNCINALDNMPCDKDFYYSIRAKYNLKIADNLLDAECAALLIWLNKHCFNGLYRVNNRGFFNVPYNNKTTGKSIDENNLRLVAEYLQNNDITIMSSDFEKACDHICKNDFVYFDSPFIPVNATSSFTSYSMGGFTLNDHKRLALLFKKLDLMGAKIMLSNNNVPLVHSLYSDYNIQELDVKRIINRNADSRTGKEVLITNY